MKNLGFIGKSSLLKMLLPPLFMMAACNEKPKGADEKIRQLEAQVRIAQEGASQLFLASLGDWRYESDMEKIFFTADNFYRNLTSLPPYSRETDTPDWKIYNKRLQNSLRKNGKRRCVSGALAAFFYNFSLEEKIFQDPPFNKSHYIALAKVILACKDDLVNLIENLPSFKTTRVDKILAVYEKKLKKVPELEVSRRLFSSQLKEKDNGTPYNCLQEPHVRAAWEAFKKEVREARYKYEVVMGLKVPPAASQ